jgi:hypothetical protein
VWHGGGAGSKGQELGRAGGQGWDGLGVEKYRRLIMFRDFNHIKKVQVIIVLYQNLIRKHQLAVAMRIEVQTFLGGFSMSGRFSLGCVDWRLDPDILGLKRGSDFCVE